MVRKLREREIVLDGSVYCLPVRIDSDQKEFKGCVLHLKLSTGRIDKRLKGHGLSCIW